MRPIYKDKKRRALRRKVKMTQGAQSDSSHQISRGRCSPLQLSSLRFALFAAVGLSQPGCPAEESVEPACEMTPSLNAQGEPTGYAACEDGRVFKVEAAMCAVPAPQGQACVSPDSQDGSQGDTYEDECSVDSDCTAGPHGRCKLRDYSDFGEVISYCGCSYNCQTDSDCGSGRVCDCADGGVGVCRRASCATNEDCASGACERSSYFDGCSQITGFFCRSEADTCESHEDCSSGQCGVAYGSEIWECQDVGCAIGRPAIVNEIRLSAPLTSRAGWGAVDLELAEQLRALSGAQRALLKSSWAEVAALEHSSVASFSRVTLELMGLSAPADLLLETQRAAADEVEHAREMYAQLSSLLGCEVGPGEFASSELSPRVDLREVALSVVREACLGETLGVAEVESALTFTQYGPARVHAHLAQVAEDETRHAALAWRTLAWLLEGASDELYDEVAKALYAEACELALSDANQAHDGLAMSLNHLGVLSGEQRARAHAQGLSEVVLPCARALLGASRVRKLELLARRALSRQPPRYLSGYLPPHLECQLA